MGNCSCIDVDIGEEITTLEKKTKTARKQHVCTECGERINPGNDYEYFKGVSDKQLYIYKTCENCLSIRGKFFCNNFHFEFIIEDLIDHIREVNGDIPSGCLVSLTKGARDKVCDMIEEYWDKYFEEEDM